MLSMCLFNVSLCMTQGLLDPRLASKSILLPQPSERLDYRSVPIFMAK